MGLSMNVGVNSMPQTEKKEKKTQNTKLVLLVNKIKTNTKLRADI